MLAATHVIFGVGLSLLAAKVTAADSLPLVVAAGAVGSLLPDIDHPKSTFGKVIWPISGIIGGIFGHRGITHSLLAVLAVAWFLWGHLPPWGLGLAVGYLSHLLADWLTPSGVPLMWPSRRMFHSPYPIRTGGAGEFLLSMALVATGTLWILK
jgi:inner membrane protein